MHMNCHKDGVVRDLGGSPAEIYERHTVQRFGLMGPGISSTSNLHASAIGSWTWPAEPALSRVWWLSAWPPGDV